MEEVNRKRWMMLSLVNVPKGLGFEICSVCRDVGLTVVNGLALKRLGDGTRFEMQIRGGIF